MKRNTKSNRNENVSFVQEQDASRPMKKILDGKPLTIEELDNLGELDF